MRWTLHVNACMKRKSYPKIIFHKLRGQCPDSNGQWQTIAPAIRLDRHCTMHLAAHHHGIWLTITFPNNCREPALELQSGHGGAQEQSWWEEGGGEVSDRGEGGRGEGESASREASTPPQQEPGHDGRCWWWKGWNVLQREMQQQGRVVEASIADRISRAGEPIVFPWKDIQPVSTSTCGCMAQHWQSKVELILRKYRSCK